MSYFIVLYIADFACETPPAVETSEPTDLPL